MANKDIPARQQRIRRWYRTQLQDPYLQWAVHDDFADADVVRNWMDMQALLACYDHGSLLADNTRWANIENELRYPARVLVATWHWPSVKRVKKALLTTYHILHINEQRRLILKPHPSISQNISANRKTLYEWLGLIGGVHGDQTLTKPDNSHVIGG